MRVRKKHRGGAIQQIMWRDGRLPCRRQGQVQEPYADRACWKFFVRFRGPYTVNDRKGVNYRIGRLMERQRRCVHHDELLPWKDRDRSVALAPEAL